MSQTVCQRVAIITGGGSGIGLATGELLLEQGWKVALLDRDDAALAEARRGLERHAAHVRTDAVDVTDAAEIERVVAAIHDSFGIIKGVVASAGVGADVPFLETSVESFRRINDINVTGTFIVAKAAAARMRANGGGGIVTIASVSGLTGNIGRTAYGASKGAVINMTRVMAVELARYNIRANCVAPGPVETPLVKTMHTQAVRKQWHERVPMERYGTPLEIAEAAAFLIDGDRSSYLTGQIIAVDGGFMACGINDRSRQ